MRQADLGAVFFAAATHADNYLAGRGLVLPADLHSRSACGNLVYNINYFIFVKAYTKNTFMELQDKPLDPEESLRLITRLISGARYNARRAAFGFIFWGVLVAVAALLNFFLAAYTGMRNPWLPWPVLTTAGFLFSVISYASRSRRRGALSTYGFFFKWLFFWGGLTYFLLVFLCIRENVPPVPFILALTSLLVGVAGLVLRFRPLAAGGVLFFAAAVAAVFLPAGYQLLLLGLTVLAGYMVPGILLTAKRADE